LHLLIHYGIRIVFVLFIAILFTILVVYRPGALHKPSKLKLAGMLCVGAVIGGIFLMTQALYAPPPGQ
jgi:hypothetical protein